MNWPQYTVIVLMAMEVGINLSLDGQPKTGTHRFFLSTISAGLLAFLLYMGGFFTGGVQ